MRRFSRVFESEHANQLLFAGVEVFQTNSMIFSGKDCWLAILTPLNNPFSKDFIHSGFDLAFEEFPCLHHVQLRSTSLS
jgi:hypothetical protein